MDPDSKIREAKDVDGHHLRSKTMNNRFNWTFLVGATWVGLT